MIRVSPTRAILLFVLAGLATGIPVFDAAARKQPPPPVIEAPPPPPPQGPVGLPDRMLDDAAAYQAYLHRMAAISPAFTDGTQVASALATGSAYDPKALVRGAIAYAAIAALQDTTFVAQVRAAGPDAESRRVAVNQIIADPAYVFGFHGSDVAAGYVKQALGGAGLSLYASGKLIKQSAYDVQRQPWSKEFVADREGRMTRVKVASASSLPPAPDMTPVMQRAASGVAPLGLTATPARPPYTPLVARALQLAAIAALGEATNGAYERLTYLTAERDTTACLNMAKLNLFQCLAVAKPHYEDIFCIGQHEMIDTGACLARYSGVGTPLEVSTKPLKVPPPKPARKAPAKRRH
jgi:hypothetical protein